MFEKYFLLSLFYLTPKYGVLTINIHEVTFKLTQWWLVPFLFDPPVMLKDTMLHNVVTVWWILFSWTDLSKLIRLCPIDTACTLTADNGSTVVADHLLLHYMCIILTCSTYGYLYPLSMIIYSTGYKHVRYYWYSSQCRINTYFTVLYIHTYIHIHTVHTYRNTQCCTSICRYCSISIITDTTYY